ncbi:MAG: hypothetical protein ABIG29_00440 [Candidatus Nealsonbacteria bacterium]
MPTYPTPEKLWELFQKLPQELKSLIFSEESARNIQDICEKNTIKDEKTISAITNYVGYVLHGVLTVKTLRSVLEKEANLEREVAEKITQDLTRVIFLPVKTSLEQLYGPDVIEKKSVTEEEKTKPAKKDSYREPVE